MKIDPTGKVPPSPLSPIDRREFMTLLAAAAVVGAPVSSEAGQLSAPTNLRIETPSSLPSQRQTLSQADFRLLGGFKLSRSPYDLRLESGVAFRRSAGQRTLLIGQSLVEFRIPSSLGSGSWDSYPELGPSRAFGNFWGPKLRFQPETPGSQSGYTVTSLHGLYWDEIDQRMYATFGDDYYTGSNGSKTATSLGAATLSDTSSTGSTLGSWFFQNCGYKRVQGGVTGIPEWFANQYCQGRRLAAGFGGYFSILSHGDVSLGPSMLAFGPPNLAMNPHLSGLPWSELLYYPSSNRAHRDADYRDDYESVNPIDTNGDGVADRGTWFWNDTMFQAGCWIDNGSKHGVIFVPYMGHGRGWYDNSRLNGESGAHWFYLYNPMDVAKVPGGAASYTPQPSARWVANFPGMPREIPWGIEPFTGGFGRATRGVAYDPIESRLYVLQGAPGYYPDMAPTVYVYQVG